MLQITSITHILNTLKTKIQTFVETERRHKSVELAHYDQGNAINNLYKQYVELLISNISVPHINIHIHIHIHIHVQTIMFYCCHL